MKNATPRVSCEDLKFALLRALKLAETGVDGPAVPNVKECINGVLKIIEQEVRREAKTATFEGLVEAITEFERVTVRKLLKKKNISDDLKNDVEGLANKLREISAQYIRQRSKIHHIKSFLLARNHAKVLDGLGEDLKSAIKEFQTSLLLYIRAMKQKLADDRVIGQLRVEYEAFYKHQVKLCEPGTRISLLENISKWAKDTGLNHPRIMWLHGRAGVGKSIVAKTVAKQFDDDKTVRIYHGSWNEVNSSADEDDR